MVRDFEMADIPGEQGFLRPTQYPSAAFSTWRSISEKLKKILICARFAEPGWISDGSPSKTANSAAPIGLFMWGQTSTMARAYDLEGFDNLKMTNSTAVE